MIITRSMQPSLLAECMGKGATDGDARRMRHLLAEEGDYAGQDTSDISYDNWSFMVEDATNLDNWVGSQYEQK